MVMFGWVMVFYILMGLQASLGMATDSPTKMHKVWSERIFYNYTEQAPAFLCSFLACALFRDPKTAWVWGTVYLALSLLYPVIRYWLNGGMGTIVVLLTTLPRYTVCLFLATNAIYTQFTEEKKTMSRWLYFAFLPSMPIILMSMAQIQKFIVAPGFVKMEAAAEAGGTA